MQSICLNLVGAPSENMGKTFHNNDAANPSMEEIKGVETDSYHGNQRIIATGEEYQGDHVCRGEHTSPATNLGEQSSLVFVLVVE